jgi:hypothetical protein
MSIDVVFQDFVHKFAKNPVTKLHIIRKKPFLPESRAESNINEQKDARSSIVSKEPLNRTS